MSDVIRTALQDAEAQVTRLNEFIAACRVVLGDPDPSVNTRAIAAPSTKKGPRQKPGPKGPRPTETAAMGERSALVLRHLQDHGATSTRGLSGVIGCSVFTSRTELKALAAKGLIHETGKTANQRWHLGAKGRQSGKPAKEEP